MTGRAARYATVAAAMLALRDVTKTFSGRVVIEPTTLEVAAGERLALVGPSGCGKSTLLKMIVGLVRPDAGTVTLGGRVVDETSAEFVRRRVGYVLQEGGLFPHMTARANVTLVARLRKEADPSTIDARVRSLADLVRLPLGHLDRYPRALSGGERQRVGLMRALMMDPDVVLLDEPLGALDPIVRAGLQEDLRTVFDDLGKCVVLVTHDMAEAAHLCPSIALLRDGQVLQRGTLDELLHAPTHAFVSEFVRAARTLSLGGANA